MSRNNMIANYEDDIHCYPKVMIPQFIKDCRTQYFTLKDIYPNYEIPKAPNSPKENDDSLLYLKSFLGCGLAAFIGFGLLFLLFGMIFFNDNEKAYSNVIRPIFLIGTILLGILGTIMGHRDVKKENMIAKNRYNHELTEFQKKKDEFATLNDRISKQDFINKERKKRLIDQLDINKKEIIKTAQILEDHEIKKGPSEELYYKFLKEYSDFQIYKSLKYGYYFPDLVLIKHNLVIDLEIDEPYTLNTKEPIHYDQIDNSRDKFFRDNDFLVIHLTEEQILKNPEYCLEIIDEIVDACLDMSESIKSERYAAFETPTWTYDMCFDFAYNNSRGNISKLIAEIQNKYQLVS